LSLADADEEIGGKQSITPSSADSALLEFKLLLDAEAVLARDTYHRVLDKNAGY
jgi:hypothetical protein